MECSPIPRGRPPLPPPPLAPSLQRRKPPLSPVNSHDYDYDWVGSGLYSDYDYSDYGYGEIVIVAET